MCGLATKVVVNRCTQNQNVFTLDSPNINLSKINLNHSDALDPPRRTTITTTDLVCWSYQVAQGMVYLARRGVLHGDLAARNLLLTHDGVVKICDFGLSRTMMPEEDYKKKTEVTLYTHPFR